MTYDGQIRLADFGSAIDVLTEPAVTRTGTEGYMAPEVRRCPLKRTPQCGKDRSDLAYGTSADIYSVGALAYELITGQKPPPVIPGFTLDLPFPRSTSFACRSFIVTAMHPDPSKRPNAEHLIDHPWVTTQPRSDSLTFMT